MAKLIKNVNDLAALYPQVAAEWDYEKNYPKTPQDYTGFSHKKVWWICKKGHSWRASIADRTRGRKCPYCSGQLPIPNETSLDVLFPEIAAEWDYEKNYPKTPQDYTAHSGKKVWWICKKGHSWRASIADRTRGRGCLYCSGKLPIPNETSLDVLFPEIAAEWDYEKNYPKTPQDYTAHSGKKVWWICKKGHSWQASIETRTRGSNCPYCYGRFPIPNETSLDVLFPEIAAEWDYEKNYPKTPQDYTGFSPKKVWWICKKGHSWQASIANRTRGSNCPYCAGKLPIKGETDLQTLYVEICKDWDYEKNKKSPSDYLPNSTYHAYWKCHKCGYRYRRRIYSQIKSLGCKNCK